MKKLRAKLCGLAEDIAINFGFQLDYSEKSIEDVEAILSRLHDEYVKTQNEDGLLGVALEFGAYLVTVIERQYGPIKWSCDHPEIGEGSFPMEWKGTTLFPVGWCHKRIIDGASDDIVTKWQVYVQSRVAST